ncbi:MAG TPA: protein translocase subunit SecD [Candidatus Paceibacterota bacterium]|nr:protein translocase subunit SecD [Candidatus Paceibacterota bacterium]
MKFRILSIVILLLGAGLGYFVHSNWYPFSLGLDLAGGTELIYTADVSQVKEGEADEAMETLRDVIERRVNLFGVSEPVVQVERGGAFGGGSFRLRVELPGITDVEEAVKRIGETPSLEFKTVRLDLAASSTASTTPEEILASTGLTGRYLERAELIFDQTLGAPQISIQFNSEGAELFEKITTEHVGEPVAILLDGEVISSPVVNEPISGGKAVISGQFAIEEARTLVRNLNYGALPLPIALAGTQSIGASLGSDAVNAGMIAGLFGFAALSLFIILWYRLPGIIAVLALVLYVLISLAAFKFIPVTLTAAGIAGFILSIGMAVDANVLIFERTKEELRKGKPLHDAITEGFHRAWLSIRDSNISSLITALVLFWLGTSAVKGFALTLGLGVLVSMFTAITVSRTFLLAVAPSSLGNATRFLFGSGATNSGPQSNNNNSK